MNAKMNRSRKRATKRMTGKVERVIPAPHPTLPEKVEVGIEQADHLYREIRIDNELQTDDGERVRLKPGAEVDVEIEAETDAIELENSGATRSKN
jgi:hypothetical protein